MENTAGRRQQRLTFLAVLALVLFGIVTIILDRAQIVHVLGKTNWALVIPALLFTALSYTLLSYTFALICRIFGVRLGGRDLFEIGFVSWALNHLLAAGGAAGYSLRMLLIQRRGLPVADVLAASLFHSVLNNLFLFTLLPVGLLLGIAAHPLATNTLILVVALALVAGILTVCAAVAAFVSPIRRAIFRWAGRVWHRVTGRDLSGGLAELDSTLGRGVRGLKARPAGLALPLILVVGDWGASMAALWFCFDALGQPVGIGVLIAGFAVGVTVGLLSMVPGGIGVQEGSMATTYALFGVPLGQAVLAAVLFRLVYYIVPFLVSLAFYQRLLHEVGGSPGQPDQRGK